jgi:hypothetical protein
VSNLNKSKQEYDTYKEGWFAVERWVYGSATVFILTQTILLIGYATFSSDTNYYWHKFTLVVIGFLLSTIWWLIGARTLRHYQFYWEQLKKLETEHGDTLGQAFTLLSREKDKLSCYEKVNITCTLLQFTPVIFGILWIVFFIFWLTKIK